MLREAQSVDFYSGESFLPAETLPSDPVDWAVMVHNENSRARACSVRAALRGWRNLRRAAVRCSDRIAGAEPCTCC